MFELVFDFEGKSIQFMNPLHIIKASSLDEVIPCLRNIQGHIEKGFYAAGYIAYEAAPAFDPSLAVHPPSDLPLLWFGIYEKPEPQLAKELREYQINEWRPSVEHQDYFKAIQMIHQAIANGETYQVNHTIRLHADFIGDDYYFYRHLFDIQQPNYAAYLHLDRYRILSASPELFFQRRGNRIITKPMKGTCPRGNTVDEDEGQAAWLYESEKNRAENVMIVDLLSNDIGKISEMGSVEVSRLFEIERYPTVFQMTSTVEGTLLPSIQLEEIFRALFPCGSITGAPKVQTMKWIQKLEDSPRGVYCGSIGYIEPSGDAMFNVAIRTVLIDTLRKQAEFGVGGGITWDSTGMGEYEEIITKSKFLTESVSDFELLETILLEDGAYFLLDYHLNRLRKSALYFGFPLNETILLEELEKTKQSYPFNLRRVRVTLSKQGIIAVEDHPLLPNQLHVNYFQLAEKPIYPDRFVFHKTTKRTIYENLKIAKVELLDTLLWNENREVTEFTIGNIVIEVGGIKYTPPVSSGILPGTYRQYLLEKGEIRERKISLLDLQKADRVWLINSLRKWVPMRLLNE